MLECERPARGWVLAPGERHSVTRRRMLRGLAAGSGAALCAALAGTAFAQLPTGGKQPMPDFAPKPVDKWKVAPDVVEADKQRQAEEEARISAELAAEKDAQADYILGIHVNTLFFIGAGVAAVLWFTIGGGRKAKLGGPKH